MSNSNNGHLEEIRNSLQAIQGDLHVLARRMDSLPARLERLIRIAVAEDQARASSELAERLRAAEGKAV